MASRYLSPQDCEPWYAGTRKVVAIGTRAELCSPHLGFGAHAEIPKEAEKHSRVLIYLAEHGPTTKYKIEKGISPKIDHSTLYKVVSQLKISGSVKVVKPPADWPKKDRPEKSRVGLKMEYYELGLIGLIGAIQQDTIRSINAGQWGKFLLKMDALSSKYPSYLPLIFGKWKFFKENRWNPDEWLRICSYFDFDWANWLNEIAYSREYQDSGVRSTYADSTYAEDFRHMMVSRTNTIGKEMLRSLEEDLTRYLYFSFFNISSWRSASSVIAEIMVDPARERSNPRPFLDRIRLGVRGVESIWVQDSEIYEWITGTLASIALSYSQYTKRFDQRKREFEALRTKVR